MAADQVPIDIVKEILAYDGRIKYRSGCYVDIIHRYDERYAMLTPVIEKKLKIIASAEIDEDTKGCYFYVSLTHTRDVGLCYDYNFSYLDGRFEICYVDIDQYGDDWIQIRTKI